MFSKGTVGGKSTSEDGVDNLKHYVEVMQINKCITPPNL